MRDAIPIHPISGLSPRPGREGDPRKRFPLAAGPKGKRGGKPRAKAALKEEPWSPPGVRVEGFRAARPFIMPRIMKGSPR